MRLLSELLLSPITGPVRTVGFAVRRIQDQVEQEFFDEGRVRAELLDLAIRYERGELSEAEYHEQEAAALRHLTEIHEYREQASEDQEP